MRRVASSRPSRWGMDTIRGLDNSSLHGCERSYGGRRAFAPAMRPAIRKEGSRSTIPLGLERDARSLAGVAAIAIRITIAHAAPAGGFGSLPAGRVAGGAGRARLAAPLVHALTGGITGCSGMAGHRPPLLHTLAGCAVLRRALRVAERGRADQQPRRRSDDQKFAHHGRWLLRFMSFHRGSRPQRPPLSARANARTGSTFPRRGRGRHDRRAATYPRPDLLRDDMDCAESWAERAGRGASTRGPRATTQKRHARGAHP